MRPQRDSRAKDCRRGDEHRAEGWAQNRGGMDEFKDGYLFSHMFSITIQNVSKSILFFISAPGGYC